MFNNEVTYRIIVCSNEANYPLVRTPICLAIDLFIAVLYFLLPIICLFKSLLKHFATRIHIFLFEKVCIFIKDWLKESLFQMWIHCFLLKHQLIVFHVSTETNETKQFRWKHWVEELIHIFTSLVPLDCTIVTWINNKNDAPFQYVVVTQVLLYNVRSDWFRTLLCIIKVVTISFYRDVVRRNLNLTFVHFFIIHALKWIVESFIIRCLMFAF